MLHSETVVLVNGLWLGDPALWLLARRLRRTSFRVYSFSYPSVRQDVRANAARLHAFLSRVPGDTVHLVGYSLGGVIVRGDEDELAGLAFLDADEEARIGLAIDEFVHLQAEAVAEHGGWARILVASDPEDGF